MTSPEKSPKRLTWPELAELQAGTLGRSQCLRAGMSPAFWDWKLASLRWASVGDGVAVTHSGSPSDEQLCWAAVLHAGKDAALSGDASLVHFGLKRLKLVAHDVAIPSERRCVGVDVPGLVVATHRVKNLDKWSAGHPHLRLVHAQAAVLHAAAWASSDEEAERRLTMAVQQRVCKPMLIRASLKQMPRLVRRELIREVLDDIELGAHAQSELEFLRFCRRNHLPQPDELQVLVRANGKKYLDARYRRQRKTIEVDGAHHMWVEQWNADTLRTLELLVASRGSGEEIIRLTRGNMRHSEVRTAELMRALLA